jgi:hypothetical protein
MVTKPSEILYNNTRSKTEEEDDEEALAQYCLRSLAFKPI